MHVWQRPPILQPSCLLVSNALESWVSHLLAGLDRYLDEPLTPSSSNSESASGIVDEFLHSDEVSDDGGYLPGLRLRRLLLHHPLLAQYLLPMSSPLVGGDPLRHHVGALNLKLHQAFAQLLGGGGAEAIF